ncbi:MULTISPECIES: hypothetical protein [Streptomycetaceae]|uniref:Restriction endonuclease type IV Mrr domain-containing protein n=1 Tax=Streptantibioticus cattleyicolor (strain ATCC 35852 / DSM 46488 / JCM 4925 / NBRC 14057 / NRRL 8057) TaxID=1003195 RepID=F8JXN2_STREN|nr:MULTISPECIES: hypothetical protein [Streptomycetaceae]AEW97134.1 hypothetical protein SCATT_47630 [Streptantibioticus cattleyicolor NRRL 8057 = DSM 46488]MYS61593.1 hypothetical protein [Streptomyces sp. SID5468]CCB77458.1 conserved protein of unknown function [Streptantibioticus cattleyicolor NRRL 8057 = DSM 46488]
MAESVPVRCPACRREHAFTPPVFPCPCGAPLTVPVLRGGVPTRIEQRTWRGSWVRLRCPACGRADDWPQPELGCSCGTVLRVPVDTGAPRPAGPKGGGARRKATAAAPVRPPFTPVTIRTARDAVTAAAQYLRWLGFTGIREAEDRAATGVDLRGDRVLGQVDPSTRPTPPRPVETLWLNCLNEDRPGAFFSLAGYTHPARLRADRLGIPLFVMDLTGTPQPVNDAADDLIGGPPTTT